MLGRLMRGCVVAVSAVALASIGVPPDGYGRAPSGDEASTGCLTEGSGAQATSLIVRIDMVSEDPGCYAVGGTVAVWREVRPAAGRW